MTNTIHTKPTCIQSTDIQRIAHQGQERASKARDGFGHKHMGENHHINKVASSLVDSIDANDKPVKGPIVAGGKRANPPTVKDQRPQEPHVTQEKPQEPPVIAGGISVPPPLTMGLIAVDPKPDTATPVESPAQTSSSVQG